MSRTILERQEEDRVSSSQHFFFAYSVDSVVHPVNCPCSLVTHASNLTWCGSNVQIVREAERFNSHSCPNYATLDTGVHQYLVPKTTKCSRQISIDNASSCIKTGVGDSCLEAKREPNGPTNWNLRARIGEERRACCRKRRVPTSSLKLFLLLGLLGCLGRRACPYFVNV